MNWIYIISALIVILFTVLVIRLNGRCVPFNNKRKNTQCNLVSSSGGVIVNPFDTTSPPVYRAPSIRPIAVSDNVSFNSINVVAANGETPDVISTSQFIKFQGNINFDTGYLCFSIFIPLRDARGKTTMIKALVDTGSNFFVVPTNLCHERACVTKFGIWDGASHCPVVNLFDPKPAIKYGSGKIYTRQWSAYIGKTDIVLNFNGLLSIANTNVPYFPPIAGMLPTYPSLGDNVSFVDQILDQLTECRREFTIDLRTGEESILFGNAGDVTTSMPHVATLDLINENDYLNAHISKTDVRPILLYTVKLVNVLFNGVPCRGVPKYAILDTGTSGFMIGYTEDFTNNDDLFQCMNHTGTLTFVLENNVELTTEIKKEDKNVAMGPTGLVDSILVGLPALLNTVMTYHLDRKQISVFKT